MTNSFIRNLYLSNSQNLLLVALFHILANIFKINMWQHFSFCHLRLADFFSHYVQYEVHEFHLPGYSGIRRWQPTARVKVMSDTFTTEGWCLSCVTLRRSSLQLLETWTGRIRPAKHHVIFSFAGVLFFERKFFPKLP